MFCREKLSCYENRNGNNGEIKLQDMVNNEIYRIAQEAINNTRKYSNASLLKVSLD